MGKSTGGETSSTQIDPDIKNILMQNYQFAQGVANRPYDSYDGQQVAGLSSQQQQAMGLMGSLADPGGGGNEALNRAIVGAQNVMNFDIGKTPIDVGSTKIAQGEAADLGDAAQNTAVMAKAAKLDDPTLAQAAQGAAASLGGPAMVDARTGQAANLAPASQARASLADPAVTVNAARIDPSKVSDVASGALTDVNLKQYMNPYDDQVVGQGTKDLDRARQMIENDIGSQASHVGAAFGSRQAVAEAENNRNFLQQVGQLSAQNRQAGYGQAANLAQSDLDRQLQAGATQQATDLAIRQANAGFEQQAGMTNAAAQNDLSQFNAGQKQSAGIANQNAANQFKLQEGADKQAMKVANLGYENDAANRNQDAANQFALQTGANQQAMSLANLGYLNDVIGRNQDAANNFAVQNAANRQQANITNAGAQNATGQANTDAINQFLMQGAANRQAMETLNTQALNQGRQFNTSTDLTQQTQNAQDRLQGQQINLAGAKSLADMGLQKQQMGMADVQGLMATGQVQQDQKQKVLDQGYQDWLNEWNYPLQQLQILQGGAQPLQQAAGSTTTTQGQSSPWGTIGSIIGIASMFSDARLKADVRTEGYDRRGRRWASWRYIWDGPDARRFGVIAQEVARTDPHAVMADRRGFLKVDYALLLAGERAATANPGESVQ